ncbi:hypothetical protein [Kurlavirus BKC-1]|nr:hypothetical protein [Kurlavirus BKC-1]
MEKRQRILAHYTSYWEKYGVSPTVEYRNNEIISISFKYNNKDLILPLCWCGKEECQKCQETKDHIWKLEMQCKFNASRCHLCVPSDCWVSMSDRERLSDISAGEIRGLSILDKAKWYYIYCERKGRETIIPKIIGQAIICTHSKEHSQNTGVQKIFMAAMCDTVALEKQSICSWMERNKISWTFCGCENIFRE